MPTPSDDRAMVINTSPLLALIAALGDLTMLGTAYSRVIVPHEVASEVLAAGRFGFGVEAFVAAMHLLRGPEGLEIEPWLTNSLDLGEAAVVATALALKINRVCIGETVGRRVARLAGLNVTGSLGVLVKLKSVGSIHAIAPCVERMRVQGIWMSEAVCSAALALAGEA